MDTEKEELKFIKPLMCLWQMIIFYTLQYFYLFALPGIQYSYPPTTFASCEGLMVREPLDPFFFRGKSTFTVDQMYWRDLGKLKSNNIMQPFPRKYHHHHLYISTLLRCSSSRVSVLRLSFCQWSLSTISEDFLFWAEEAKAALLLLFRPFQQKA